jgi:hypothetical protein
LKAILIIAPVLRKPDFNLPFILTTDASDTAIGQVLSQDDGNGERPVAYKSRRMTAAEINYPIYKKEMLAVIHALKVFRIYLEGQKFKVITDYKSLTYWQTQPVVSRRQARWTELLAEYDFEMEYRPGKTNVVADALSRVLAMQLNVAISVIPDKKVLQTIREQTPDDKNIGAFYKGLQGEEVSERIQAKLSNFELVDGILIHIKDGKRRISVPRDSRTLLLEEAHDLSIVGHFGAEKTLELLQRSFWWPRMNRTVERYIASCEQCQRNKGSNQKPAGLLQPLETPTKNWQQVSMDLIVQLPKTKAGNDAIVVFVDRLSKMVHYQAVKTTITAPELAKVFFNTVFKLHGMPRTIVSDRDPKFTSLFWKALFKCMGTKLSMSTAFHPQTDGQTERSNRTLEQMLRNWVNYKQDDWDEHLAAAEFACNNAKQASTGVTPFFANTGQDPSVPVRFLCEDSDDEENNVQSTEDFVKKMSDILKNITENLNKA